MLYKVITLLLRNFYGKKYFQGLFITLHKIALSGMNFGNSEFDTNGEKNGLHLVRKLIKNKGNKKIIFDVGANIGQYAKILMAIFDKQALIYSFEPSLAAYKELSTNLSSFNNCKPINIGLGDKQEERVLYYDTNLQPSTLSSLYQRNLDHINLQMSFSEKVTINTIDNFCNENNITNIDFLKIDVEGNELNVLLGAQNMLLKKSIEIIQFEFGGTCIDSKTFFKDFYNLLITNYKIFRILKDGLFPIDKYEENLEIFQYSNFIAILK